MNRVTRNRLAASALAGALAVGPALLLAPAAAAAPADGTVGIVIDKTTNLSDGETVRVTGSGADPEVGYYLAVCKDGTEDTVADCISGPAGAMSAVWVSNMTDRGAQVPISADGSFTAELAVTASGETFGSEYLDCGATGCAVTLFRDHMNGLDVVASDPLTFGDAAVSIGVGEPAADAAADTRESSSALNGETDWWGAWVGGAVGVAVVLLGGFGAAVSRL